MRRVRLLLMVVLAVTLAACSKSGKTGTGDAGDGMDSGSTIPLAKPGSEMPDVQFAFDSSALSSAAQMTLKDSGRFLLDNPGKSVVVEGHCDERGTNEYNLALGERRARSAYDFLRSLGVKKEQMSTVSYGEELPLDPGHSESAWSKNRRAHFSVKK